MFNNNNPISGFQEKSDDLPESTALSIPRTDKNWRKSLVGRGLENMDQKMFERASNGDLQGLKQLVSDKKVDINKTDYQGHSVLHVAISKNDNDMVNYLVKSGDMSVERLKDCAMFCIKANKPERMNAILAAVRRLGGSVENDPCKDSTDFPDYMTPLMLAAMCGHLELVECLLYRRHHPPIYHPHRTGCVCEECVYAMKHEDPLKESITKLERYRAICNPAYVCQTSEDPVLTAFQLVDELKRTASQNRIFLRDYEELIQQTSRFSADLVAHCRDSKEVKIMLNERNGTDMKGDFLFPRLILAMEYHQKQFVAERNVQEVLDAAWVSDWYDWRGYSDKERTVIILGRVFMLPVVCLICICIPNSTWSRFYSIPLNRMISSVASYFIFLGLLFWESDRDKRNQTRYDIQYYIGRMMLVLVFVVAHVFSSLRVWFKQGSRRFFSYKWNIYDLLNATMFLLAFSFWLSALLTLSSQPNLERKYWHYLDPQLLSEGFFCIATVMSFGRLLLLVQMHSDLGPMQVSLLSMAKDFSQFIIIFAIVIGSFMAGMCTLYQYYDEMKQIDPETGVETRQESSFVTAYDTFKVLFWGILCMSSQEAATVVIENLPTEEGDMEGINSHDFTQAVGYVLFAIYTVLTVIVLLNMLIAAMSNTFVMVTVDNVDIEWVFGRTEVYLDFMSQTVLPPPLSILPNIVGCVSWLIRKVSKRPEKELKGAEQPSRADSDELIIKLVSRYFSQKDKEKNNVD